MDPYMPFPTEPPSDEPIPYLVTPQGEAIDVLAAVAEQSGALLFPPGTTFEIEPPPSEDPAS